MAQKLSRNLSTLSTQSEIQTNKNIEKILETQLTQTQIISKLSKSMKSGENNHGMKEALVKTNKAVNNISSLSKTLSHDVEDIQDSIGDLRNTTELRFRDLENDLQKMKCELKLYKMVLTIELSFYEIL